MKEFVFDKETLRKNAGIINEERIDEVESVDAQIGKTLELHAGGHMSKIDAVNYIKAITTSKQTAVAEPSAVKPKIKPKKKKKLPVGYENSGFRLN